jgi:hypothetical protein
MKPLFLVPTAVTRAFTLQRSMAIYILSAGGVVETGKQSLQAMDTLQRRIQ